jgi:glutamate-1-semialdehyde aminotransferase
VIEREREEFARRHPRSRELHERAAGSLLAGVPMSWMTMWAGGHPIYLLNRGVLITPFHNMALMCPATTEEQVDPHTEAFTAALEDLKP